MLDDLHNQLPQTGQLVWIGVRPSKTEEMISVEAVQARAGRGLTGDRYKSVGGKRQVTLIQWEHLAVIAANLGVTSVVPEYLRRNLAISGLNLLALKGRQFYVGPVLLEYTGLCQPCSAMERRFGPGGFNAMLGHGGITARILTDGVVKLHDPVALKS